MLRRMYEEFAISCRTNSSVSTTGLASVIASGFPPGREGQPATLGSKGIDSEPRA